MRTRDNIDGDMIKFVSSLYEVISFDTSHIDFIDEDEESRVVTLLQTFCISSIIEGCDYLWSITEDYEVTLNRVADGLDSICHVNLKGVDTDRNFNIVVDVKPKYEIEHPVIGIIKENRMRALIH